MKHLYEQIRQRKCDPWETEWRFLFHAILTNFHLPCLAHITSADWLILYKRDAQQETDVWEVKEGAVGVERRSCLPFPTESTLGWGGLCTQTLDAFPPTCCQRWASLVVQQSDWWLVAYRVGEASCGEIYWVGAQRSMYTLRRPCVISIKQLRRQTVRGHALQIYFLTVQTPFISLNLRKMSWFWLFAEKKLKPRRQYRN